VIGWRKLEMLLRTVEERDVCRGLLRPFCFSFLCNRTSRLEEEGFEGELEGLDADEGGRGVVIGWNP